MSQPFVVRTPNQVASLKSWGGSASGLTLKNLHRLYTDPTEAMWALKFEPQGHHPLTEAPVNFVQQLIESFNIMGRLATVKHMLESFPD